MSKLDNQSVEQLPESVDFFNSKPTLAGIDNCSFLEYPATHPQTDGPINFRINTGQCFVDFSKSYLLTQFKLLKKEGQQFIPVTKDDPVSFIQGFGATFIRNIKVMFNKWPVYHGTDLYGYKAYMKRRLGIGGKSKFEDLQATGYFEDELSQISGPGFEARKTLFADGKTFTATCPLDVDIFQQKKLLLDNMIVDIEVRPNTSAFTLLSTGTQEYKFEIVDCKLYVKSYLLNPELNHPIQDSLNKGVCAKYNFIRTSMKHEYISPGRLDYEAVLFNHQLPKRIFVGLVDAKAFNGHIGLSPFEFAPHGLESIQVSANGAQVPTSLYKLQNGYIRAYKDLSDTTEHGISLAKYHAHSRFYGFDFQAEHDQDIVELRKEGTTRIALNFSVPVPANGLQLLIYGEFDSILAIDNTRNFGTQPLF